MSAEHIYPVADKAARTVDPMLLAGALDHIARTARRSRSQTRRIRWICARAEIALAGREYSDADLDLPQDAGPETAERLKKQVGRLKRSNKALIEALAAYIGQEAAEAIGGAESGGAS